MQHSNNRHLSKAKRVVFMGSSDFSLAALHLLHHRSRTLQDIYLAGVYTQEPKIKGRGQKNIEKTPLHLLAQVYGIPVYTPKTLKSLEAQDFLKNTLQPDLIIVASYGLILPKKILDIPPLGCINLHPSLLPRWRGSAPVQHTLWAEDSLTAATLMEMDSGVDTGPIIAQEIYKTKDLGDTSPKLMKVLGQKNAELLMVWLSRILDKTYTAQPQQEAGVTLAFKLSKDSGALDWRHDAHKLVAQVNALLDWPGSFFFLNNKRIKVTQAIWRRDLIEHRNDSRGLTQNQNPISNLYSSTALQGSFPSTFYDDSRSSLKNDPKENFFLYPIGYVWPNPFGIRCAKGWFCPITVIPEGKKEMDIQSFLRGCSLETDLVLSIPIHK
jgi:methionyl-tRNA formyltransferase